jgi:two-component system chemotaxis sensor kinase CheA
VIDDGMDEIVDEFLAECNEILNTSDEILVQAESTGLSDDGVSSLFRGIHTIKGTAAFLDFGRISSVAHEAEHLLSKVRDNNIAINKARIDLLLESLDALRSMLAEVESTGRDGEAEYTDLTGRLAAASELGYGDLVEDEVATLETAGRVFDGTTSETDVSENNRTPEKKAESEQASIRVDTGVLDRLIDLVGELVLARNQLVASGVDAGTAGQRLDHVVTELQEGIMKTRMQPVSSLLTKAPRIARDAANVLQKRVRVAVDAGDTELDRGVLEAVRDPLTHLLRNAVDHGVERPAERLAAGKPPEGVIDIKAWYENGFVVVEVRDDGRGIDPERVKTKALERGLLDSVKVSELTPSEVYKLLLLPGFSTADTVTAVSGRGVGMDVVRSNIERIGGTIEVESELGVGTSWILRIPLTLAILPALIVRVGSYVIAIPSSSLREALRVDASSLECVGAREVLRLRGDMLPIIRLRDVFGEKREENAESLRIILVTGGLERVGLVVDEIGDPSEVVVKPLGSLLSGLKAVTGAAIMGDGRVAYILDMSVVSSDTSESRVVTLEQTSQENESRLPEVLVGVIGDRRVAFEMSNVERLERFEKAAFEDTGSRRVVQYRGGLLEIEGETDSGYVVVCREANGDLYGVSVDSVEDVSEVQIADRETYVVGGAVAGRFTGSTERR